MPTRQRADAIKNRERLISEARALFTGGSGSSSLEAIAQAAGVGIGTLYRHFPTREALVEAVYRSELDALEAKAETLLSAHPAFEAMRRWMDRYARFVVTKHAMHDALRVALTPRMAATSETRSRINGTIAKFISAGTRDKTIRRDVEPDDVTLSLAGIVLAATTSADQNQIRRLLDLFMDGLRPRA
jgi:AcrR family transcriptional regulator